METVTESVEETYAFAKKIADKCSGGEVILLNGILGAGKTTFTKGFAFALGVANTVTSPTFTLMKSYKGRLTLHHFDMYRITDEKEVEELGLSDYLYDENGVSVIEWNKFCDLPPKVIKIDVSYVSETSRKFVTEGIIL
jgi:tRNA threonylcarbamoyladenosine biosynthesis protein TsaE